jgi:hypothetical protein
MIGNMIGKSTILAFAMLALCGSTASLSAQERPPAAVDPKACAPGERLQRGDLAQPGAPGKPETTGESLSDKLARTDGVLCPPNVDPGIKAPTPEVGRKPVIPPPGSPGGDPSVQPK